SLKVEELYECLNLLAGCTFTNNVTKESTTITGFCNEKTISEGVRRIANKVLKKVSENYPSEQYKSILALSVEEFYNGTLPEGYENFEENIKSEDNIKLGHLKQSKLKELTDNPVNIVFEELPDWEVMNKRLEDRKENLSHNYTYLFERLFLNY